MTDAATDCPVCPECRMPRGSLLATRVPGHIMCAACGHDWRGTVAEHAQAMAADAAYEALLAAVLSDRERARELFRDAGKPIPAWLEEPT